MNRQLMLPEQMMCLMTEQIPINFGMFLRLEGELTESGLRDALRKMQVRHAHLRIRMEERPDGIFYTDQNVPEIPLEIVENAGPNDWTEITSRELTRPFNPRVGPLLRLVWVKSGRFADLILICHHAIGDGISAVNFFRDLLQALGNPAGTLESLPMQPYMSSLISVTPSMKFQAWVAHQFIGLMALKNRLLGKKPAMQIKPLAEMKHHLHPHALSASETTRLVERARREKTTVHAALAVAFMRAFGEFDNQTPAAKRWKRQISSPINLRPILNQPMEAYFGGYIALRETAAQCAPERDFWQVAREFKKALLAQTEPAKLASMLFIESTFTLRDLEGVDFFNKKYDTSITNLGRVEFPEQVGPLKVVDIYGPIVCASENENVVGVTTLSGGLRFVFVTDQATLPPQRVEEIIHLAVTNIRQAIA